MILLLLDTGLRIDGALGLERRNVDLERLVLKVAGKGSSLAHSPRCAPGHARNGARMNTKLASERGLRFALRDDAGESPALVPLSAWRSYYVRRGRPHRRERPLSTMSRELSPEVPSRRCEGSQHRRLSHRCITTIPDGMR